ncbi:probable methyltransferase TARBP1 [Mizuhopecten yessoensis]|uniref:probable methyltransferase TARBP1 n=1 Tax=Mizuhopecten yessoensis TaxID=6573 RepID=UPI000B458F6C|nr:probable methyltransferase TARBP1 [Mizuhopecten yessoensis]
MTLRKDRKGFGHGIMMTDSNYQLLRSPHINKEKLVDDVVYKITPVISDDNFTNPELLPLLGFLENIVNNFSVNDVVVTKVCDDTSDRICLPILRKLHPSFDSRSHNLVLLSRVGSLQALCAQRGSPKVFVSVLHLCSESLNYHILERTTSTNRKSESQSEYLDVICALEVVKNLIRICIEEEFQQRLTKFEVPLDKHLEEVFKHLLNILQLFDQQTIIHMSSQSLLLLLKFDNGKPTGRLAACWNTIISIWKEDNLSCKPSMLLCSLANYFLPAEGNMVAEVDLRKFTSYWSIIQAGFGSENTLVRKQCMYLLKRTVDLCQQGGVDVKLQDTTEHPPKFCWTKLGEAGLSKLWEDVIMLVETLEEKQVHVVSPLLPRMQNLIKASSVDQDIPLHTSWLTALIRRALKHESVTIMRWAAETVLFLDLELCPLLYQGEEKYICGEFLLAIQDSKHFSKPTNALQGTASNVGRGLTDFFANCWRALKTEEKRVSFFRDVLHTMSGISWGPLPFLFLCKGLSYVPSSPLLDKDIILSLRKTMSATLNTIHSYIRGAAQCYFAEALVNLVDTRSVLPKELAAVLAVFSMSESLQRGTTLWKKVVNQIEKFCGADTENWTHSDIQNYLHQETTSFVQVTEGSKFLWAELEAVQIVRFTFLAVDAKLLPLVADINKPQPSLSGILGELTEIANTVNSRPYLPAHKAERAIELLLCFVSELGTLTADNDALYSIVREGLASCRAELLLFIEQRMTGGWRETNDLPSIELCEKAVAMVTRCFHDNSSVSCIHRLVTCCLQTLRQVSALPQVSMEGQIQLVGAGAVLGAVATVHTVPWKGLTPQQQALVEDILRFTQEVDITVSLTRPSTVESREEWGRFSSKFLSSQWTLQLLYLTLGRPLHRPATILLDLCLECLSLTKADTVLVVLKCIKSLLPLVTNEGSVAKVIETLELAWVVTQENTRGTGYLTVMSEFITMAFQPALLSLPEDSPIVQKLAQNADLLLELGEGKNGLFHLLASNLCHVWADAKLLPHMTKFYSIMVSCCLYGTIHKRQEKQTMELNAYIQALGNTCSVNEVMESIPTDTSVRAYVIALLLRLQTDNPAHTTLVQGLIDTLIDRYRVITSAHKGTTFPNSMAHRQKNRAFQFFVLLEPFIVQENVDKMWKLCIEVMGQPNQPSIRNLVQWLMLRLILRFDFLVDKLIHMFVDLDERNTVVICGLLCTVALLGPHLRGNRQTQYYMSAVSAVLPWCMAHHFNTRIHAQVTIMKLSAQCRALGISQVLTAFPFLDSVTRFIEESKNYNSTKNLTKLTENFFMKDFDFERDFSIETIFHSLPRLACLMDDEWILPNMFLEGRMMATKEAGTEPWIPILNPSDSLASSAAGTWKIANKFTAAGNEQEDEEESGDFQKKIMPWRLMTPDDEAQEELDFCKKRHQAGGLVLVTSLIEKLPNLGGLCRTSEIFGVSEFVIGRMKNLEDKMFQTLSVTAQKWLPITEVYKKKLTTFLTEKKQAGYTLIGVEQTANSVSLTDFQFPYKSLLLLGNEREGIPVELINMLDVCVEIPQQGIIRSLNVHVSGALLVWEYRRQQLVIGAD